MYEDFIEIRDILDRVNEGLLKLSKQLYRLKQDAQADTLETLRSDMLSAYYIAEDNAN